MRSVSSTARRGSKQHVANTGLRFRHETHENRNSVEHISREVKRRTNQLKNCLSHATVETMERDSYPVCVAGFTGVEGGGLVLLIRLFKRAIRRVE